MDWANGLLCVRVRVHTRLVLRRFSTIGAGDTFIGAMLYGLHAHAHAHAHAAAAATFPGASAGLAGRAVRETQTQTQIRTQTQSRLQSQSQLLAFAVGLATKKVQREGFAGLAESGVCVVGAKRAAVRPFFSSEHGSWSGSGYGTGAR